MDKPPQTAPSGEPTGEEDDFMPSISLERYMSSRKRHRSTWVHLTTIAFMLAALVAVFVFKDQCGQSLSNTIFMHSREQSEPLRLQSPPAAPPSKAPAKQSTEQ